MSSRSKKRQTMAKMTRERTVKERRAQKREKKDEKKQAALAARTGEAAGNTPAAPVAEDERPRG
jgi:hypothetical protein